MKKTTVLYNDTFIDGREVTIACWKDNSVVTLLSNWDVVEPPVNAKGFSKTG